MNTFTIVFLTFLTLTLTTQLWLAMRQIRHVSMFRHAVPDSFRGKISLAAHEKAADYTITNNRIGMVDEVYGTVILLGWTLAGGLAWLDRLWTGAPLQDIGHGTAVLLSLLLIGGLLQLPFSIYNTFVVEQRFGFNKTTPRIFVMDLLKSSLLTILISGPLFYAVLWLMAGMGELWWLYVWLFLSAFNLLAIWAYPTLIAPLFNKFSPLEEGAVRQRVQALLQRTGFRSKGIFVMDGSRRSAHGNAYFTGFGKSKRIVFFDTLLNNLNESEVEAVLAHELGHFKRHHVIKRMVLMFVISLLGLALLGWLIDRPWFYQGLGVPDPSIHTALALFMLVMPIFSFFLSPIFSWGSRRHEFEADEYACQQSSAGDLINALVKLYKENAKTLTPDPIHSVFYDSHPPAPVRIAHLQEQPA